MDTEQIEKLIDETLELVEVNAHSLADAKPRASRFLIVNALLTSFLREIEEELPKLQTLVNATYSQSIQYAEGKNITEKKVAAEASVEYSHARESKEKLDALREWVKGHIKIFDHAHLMFRQYSRE